MQHNVHIDGVAVELKIGQVQHVFKRVFIYLLGIALIVAILSLQMHKYYDLNDISIK